MTFEQALIAAGLQARRIAPDGKWYRCPTEDKPKSRNGAYKLLPCGSKGYIQNHAIHQSVIEWNATKNCPKCGAENEHWRNFCEGCHEPLPSLNLGITPDMQRRLNEQRERDIAERKHRTRLARDLWGRAEPYRPHRYLLNKGLTSEGCAGLRLDGDILLVPVFRGEWLVSLQRITPAGEKKFFWGASASGGSFVIERRGAAVTCIAEGLATGLAVFQCLPMSRVIVTFNTGNMLPALEHVNVQGSAVVCADNDTGTAARLGTNPGIEAAHKVADALGCGMAYPKGIEGTDWADALKEWGERAPKRIQREILAQARMVIGRAEVMP